MQVTIASDTRYTLQDFVRVARNIATIQLDERTVRRAAQNFVAAQAMAAGTTVYGLTTGVGDLASLATTENISTVQKNILCSHDVGVGPWLPKEVVRGVIFARLTVLARSVSGVRPELLACMAELLNKDLIPRVPSLGSIGASDLTVLAGTFACLCGQGLVEYRGEQYQSSEAFDRAGIKPLGGLQNREGLALINGNDASIAQGALLVADMDSYLDACVVAAALSMEARTATSSAYRWAEQLVGFEGRRNVAKRLSVLLAGSGQIVDRAYNTKAVIPQDPPSIKTITNVIGGAYDALDNASRLLAAELNNPRDNPLLITKGDSVQPVSSGSYLCIELASAFDLLVVSLVQVAQSSVSRLKLLLNDEYSEGLPPYLAPDPANNSGFMVAAYTAESILSEMRAMAYPRSVLSATVANGWEDVSSNAYNAVRNAVAVFELAREVLALETAVALQALALRRERGASFAPCGAEVFDRAIRLSAQAGIHLPLASDADVAGYVRLIRGNSELLLKTEKNT